MSLTGQATAESYARAIEGISFIPAWFETGNDPTTYSYGDMPSLHTRNVSMQVYGYPFTSNIIFQPFLIKPGKWRS